MEALYIIMALAMVVITNIYCTTVIADRYNIYNIRNSQYDYERTVFIGASSLLAFYLCGLTMKFIAGPDSGGVIGLSFDLFAPGSVVLAWVVGLIAYHSIKGFIRNFRKFLPRLSLSTNKLIDKIVGVKDILFIRAKERVVAELHKDEEIKQLTAKLHEFEALLQLNQANQPAALTLAPVETTESTMQLPAAATSIKNRKKPTFYWRYDCYGNPVATSPRKRTKPTGGTGVTTNP